MKSNDWGKSKKSREKRGKERREGERRREERTEEKESSQPSTSSLTILIKLYFFPINVLHLVIAIKPLHKRRII